MRRKAEAHRLGQMTAVRHCSSVRPTICEAAHRRRLTTAIDAYEQVLGEREDRLPGAYEALVRLYGKCRALDRISHRRSNAELERGSR